MQVSVEATGSLERRMTVEVPEQRVTAEVQNRLQKLSRTVRMKGFRPGKVPFKVVEQQYGGAVRDEVIGEVVQASYYEALLEQKLRPAGAPRIEPTSVEPGRNLAFTAVFEVFPEVEPASLDNVTIERVTASVVDADVDKVIEDLRRQRASWEKVERAAANGDRVIIDFRGTIDGNDFPGNKGQSVPVVLGSKSLIDGFEEGLVGSVAGEERALDLAFPEDYGYKDVAGKPARFEVKVQAVEEPKYPDIDDAFAEAFGVKGGVSGLREEVRKNLERELDQALRTRNKEKVMDTLLELNSPEMPKALVEQETDNLLDQMTRGARNKQSIDRSLVEPQAKRRVALGLVLSEIISRNGLKASPEQVRSRVESLAASYEHPEEVVKWYYDDKQRLSEVESVVLEDLVVEWVFANAKVNEVQLRLDEAMKPQRSS